MTSGPAALALETDAERLRGLRRMRAVALGLLLLAALVYLLTLDRGGAWGYLHAGAEASMVGAVADWFAVTALFRRPLGLPIPHTALIPTRKDTLARNLQDFVTANFLVEDVVRTRVEQADVTRRVGRWLTDERHSRRVVDEVATVVRTGLHHLDDEDVSDLLVGELLPRLAQEPLAEVTGELLAEVVAEGAHHGLVDLAVDEAHSWLVDNRESFAEIVLTRAPWWTPDWLDERVVHRLHRELVAWVRDIRDDPDHHARRALDDLLAQLAHDLQHDPATMQRAERLKARLLAQPQVAESAMSLWRALRRSLDQTLDSPDSALRRRAVTRLAAFGSELEHDEGLQRRFDGYLADATVFLVDRYGAELTTVITETVQRWDGAEAARRIELHVGRDLQFIRINGTLVGGLAGLVIYTLTQLT